MSKPVEPRRSGPVPPTKERLDELDALLERMLSLPVNQLAEPDMVPTRSAAVLPLPDVDAEDEGSAEEHAAATATAPFYSAPPELEPEPVAIKDPMIKIAVMDTTEGARAVPAETLFPEPALANPFVFATHDEALAVAAPSPGQVIDVAAVPSDMAERSDLVLEEGTDQRSLPLSAGKTSRHRPFAFVLLRPLVWGNRAFDACAALLGAPGRWLSGPVGRAALGWTGLALLSAALVWGVLDWIGWTW